MQTASRKVGEFLVNRKVLSKDDLEYALRKEADSGVSLAKIAAGEGLVSERDLLAAVADQLSGALLGPRPPHQFPHFVDGIIPAELAGKQMVVCGGRSTGTRCSLPPTTLSTTGRWPS